MKKDFRIAVVSYNIGHGTHAGNYVANYSPYTENCFMFCDNIEHKSFIESRGWVFCYIDCSDIMHLSNQHANNMRGKKIKFLQILKTNEYNFLNTYDFILCIDHKIKIWSNTVEYIVDHSTDHPVNLTTMGITSIDGEFEASMTQTRYKLQELEYKTLIEDYVNRGCSSTSCRPINGFICYNLMLFRDEVFRYVDDVYSTLLSYNVIQDQIVTFFINQLHKINYMGFHSPALALMLLTPNDLLTQYNHKENNIMPLLIG
jgi:hypothetical protein